MSGARRVAVVWALVLALLAAGTPRLAAETSASREGCTIVVTIKIAFHGAVGDADLGRWERGIEEFWNGKDVEAGACPVRFEVERRVVDSAEDCPEDFHCIELVDVAVGESFRSVVHGVESDTRGDPGASWEEGSTDSYTGEWADHDSVGTVIHESYHLLGFPDEYDEETRRATCPEGHKVCVGGPVHPRFGEVATFPDAHAQNLVAALGVSCPDECHDGEPVSPVTTTADHDGDATSTSSSTSSTTTTTDRPDSTARSPRR